MITLNESSNWIAQHHNLLGILCSVIAVLSATAFITLFYTSLWKDKSTKSRNLALGASLAILITSGCLIVAITMQGPRYSGSADYTIEQVKTQSSGKQIIVVNDGKSDVELNVDDDDKTSYAKGDKVNVEVQSFNTKQSGKHYLGSIIKESANESVLSETDYTIKKID